MSTAVDDGRLPVIQGGLPATIAGVVFWGMVLLGLITGVILLHGDRDRQGARDRNNALLLTQRMVFALKSHPTGSEAPSPRAVLAALVHSLRPSLDFEAVQVTMAQQTWRFGHVRASQYAVTRAPSMGMPGIRVRVYFQNLTRSVTKQRNNLMLTIGLVMSLFGLILQTILQRVLSRPFASMVSSARQFADGNTTARMDEGLSDEFGFLATFVNRALDSLVRQQAELQAALTRAAQSEVALCQEKERAELTLYALTDAVITANAAGAIQYINPVAERLTGWSNDAAYNLPLDTVVHIGHEDTGERLLNPAHACVHCNHVETLPHHAVLLHRNGEAAAVEISAAPMHGEQGVVIGSVTVFQDVRETRRLARQLTYQACHDALTGLLNRSTFEQRLSALLASATDYTAEHALFYLDIDQFKIVNDTCGHIAGDALLRQIAVALRKDLREEDVLARLGGDEFGVLLQHCSLSQATKIAEALRQRIKELRFVWQDTVFGIGVSIGVVAITADNLDSTSILGAADLSCYAAKDLGRNRVHVYQPTDAALVRRHGDMRWTSMIVEGLKHNRFLLYRQQVRALTTGRHHQDHDEVLIRMRGHDGHLIMPASFIPAAERYDLMPTIDRWVIRNTFSAIANGAFGTTRREERGPIVAVNLSGASLGDGALLDFIRSTRDEFGISLSAVCFEITETVAISNLAAATQLIKELRDLGCRFALDDFGSGVSSFGYLKHLPVDYLKIDGGFVKDMVTDRVDRAIVETINHIGQIMQMQTIAECVENAATLSALEAIGVHFAQGFHISRPQPLPQYPLATLDVPAVFRAL